MVASNRPRASHSFLPPAAVVGLIVLFNSNSSLHAESRMQGSLMCSVWRQLRTPRALACQFHPRFGEYGVYLGSVTSDAVRQDVAEETKLGWTVFGRSAHRAGVLAGTYRAEPAGAGSAEPLPAGSFVLRRFDGTAARFVSKPLADPAAVQKSGNHKFEFDVTGFATRCCAEQVNGLDARSRRPRPARRPRTLCEYNS
jgi:hypothetical protein